MTAKKSSTYQTIINTARKMFMHDGYRATSTRKIAQEVGITQPNLYYHFKNKEALFIALLEDLGSEVNAALTNFIYQSNLSFSEKLFKMTEYLQENEPIDIYSMMKDIQKDLSEETIQYLYRIYLRSYKQPFIDLFETNISSLRSHYNATDLASYYFITIAPYVNSDNIPYKTLSANTIIDMFLYGISKEKD